VGTGAGEFEGTSRAHWKVRCREGAGGHGRLSRGLCGTDPGTLGTPLAGGPEGGISSPTASPIARSSPPLPRAWRTPTPAGWHRHGRPLGRPICRWLAAKAFASWLVLQGAGLRTAVLGLRVALGVLRAEAARGGAEAGRALDAELLKDAVRRADLLLSSTSPIPRPWPGRSGLGAGLDGSMLVI